MPRLKTEAARRSLLRRVRRQRLNYITILPSLITILNGVCGFTAIIYAGKDPNESVGPYSCFGIAGYLIILAMVADMLDGRLARMSQNTSSFGGQLDSLCDIVSFGVAPAFLMLKVLEHELVLVGLGDEQLLHRFIWLAAAAYMSCAAIRLARFNVENEEDESAHMSFIGLPSPAAAGVIVSLVIFHQQTLPEVADKNAAIYALCESAIMYALPVAAIGVAMLMVSRFRYPHLLNQYLKGKKPFGQLIRVLLLLVFACWQFPAALMFVFCVFAASSVVKKAYYRIIKSQSLEAVAKLQGPE
ncbi:MAG TPA: CDP-alcohol phosphatidyltransferase family protein [Sedimentisphaerales bacterium]|nr:CDP-alcohol phosphatidyltransferase family protein [Sedimentisphaerales bacterium]